ncbi:MAG: hypothetical protein WC081_07020 [Candidatus Ratteibacteria bacterium]
MYADAAEDAGQPCQKLHLLASLRRMAGSLQLPNLPFPQVRRSRQRCYLIEGEWY